MALLNDADKLIINGQEATAARLGGSLVWELAGATAPMEFGRSVAPPMGGGFPGTTGRALISRFEKTNAGSLTEMHCWFRDGEIFGGNAKFILLADESGTPGDVLLVSAPASIPEGPIDISFALPGDVSAADGAGFYWLGIVADAFTAEVAKNDDAGTGVTLMANGTFNYATPPASWPGTDGTYDGCVHAYCTYDGEA
jgi:hypothetical protein